MDERPTWRTVGHAAANLETADEELLDLVTRLPLVPTARLLPFSAEDPRAVYRRVARLRESGLVTAVAAPSDGAGRRRLLLLPTNLGLAVLASQRGVEPASLARARGLHRTALRAVIAELPALLASYALLALLAEAGRPPVRLRAWARPWRWRGPSTEGRPGRRLRLPAYAALAWVDIGSRQQRAGYVLVPDTVGLSPAALRPQLAAVARLGRTTELAVPGVVIATTSERRVEAWRALLDEVAASRRGGPLLTHVAAWPAWTARAVTPFSPDRGVLAPAPALVPLRAERERPSWTSVPQPIAQPEAVARVAVLDLAPCQRAALDLLGRHPFLAAGVLADVLGRNVRSVRADLGVLVQRGLARVVLPDELPRSFAGRPDVLELTLDGLHLLAGYLGLSLAGAVRHHGLAGGGPAVPVGPRRALLNRLTHTLGADAMFAALASCARQQRGELLEWRNAAACTHGRLRPDGYGLLRMGQREYGLFLEFDRGTVRPRALRAKFAAYHRYRASARAAREYRGFPTVLAVSTGPGAEERLAQAIQAADVGHAVPLDVLLTTVGRIETHRDGFLGAVWRTAESCRRRPWPTLGLRP